MITHTLPGFASMALDGAAVASGQAFLVGELEKRDPKLREPLTSVTWARDIVAKTGGGYVEFTSHQYVDYATVGTNQWGIVTGQTNAIPLVQANTSKDTFPVFPWMNNMRVPFLDQQKMSQIGRALDEIYNNGIRLNYNKTLDQNVYLGFTEFGTKGLINNANVTAANAPLNAAGTSRLWVNKTPNEILNDFNTALNAAWAASEYDINGIPNHILIPPLKYAYLNTTLISSAGNISILEYVKNHNVAQSQGRNVEILPSRWCIGQGAGATDRMAAYVNDEDKTHFDITVPITRSMTQPSVEHVAYLTNFVSLFGVVKFLYPQTAYYLDGI